MSFYIGIFCNILFSIFNVYFSSLAYYRIYMANPHNAQLGMHHKVMLTDFAVHLSLFSSFAVCGVALAKSIAGILLCRWLMKIIIMIMIIALIHIFPLRSMQR